ncbi:unnamed protein product [Heterobilharzia americana]|nr:unnamed protein product [Heterobilharzia americana]
MQSSYDSNNEECGWPNNMKNALEYCNDYTYSNRVKCPTCDCGCLHYETNAIGNDSICSTISSKFQEQVDAYRGYMELFQQQCLCEVTQMSRIAPILPHYSIQQTVDPAITCQPVCFSDLLSYQSMCDCHQQLQKPLICGSCSNTRLPCQNPFQSRMIMSPLAPSGAVATCCNGCSCAHLPSHMYCTHSSPK